MDITMLTALLAPCLPFLLKKVGEPALGAVANKLGEDTWGKAKEIWAKLRPTVENEEAARIAATKLAEKPDSEVWRAAFQEELEALLEKDKALKEAIAEILEVKAKNTTDRTQIQQTVSNNQGQVIGQMQNSKAKSIGSIGSIGGDVQL